MSRQSFSIGATETKNLIASDKTFLIALEVDVKDIDDPNNIIETLYLVSNNEDMRLGGTDYTAFPFRVDFNYEAGSQASLTVIARDVTRDLQSRMQAHNGGVGFEVRLKIFHQDEIDGKPAFEEEFQIISASSNDYTVSWSLGAENLLDRNFPARRQYRERCSWVYKSSDCGYGGSNGSCDYTFYGANGCMAHGNALNYGGFPSLTVNG